MNGIFTTTGELVTVVNYGHTTALVERESGQLQVISLSRLISEESLVAA